MNSTDYQGLEPAKWLTRKEAATHLKLGESTLAKLFISGEGPAAIKIGKSVRYALVDLDVWMRSRRLHSTSEVASQKIVRAYRE